MVLTFPNPKDDFDKEMPIIDKRPSWQKNHNSKNDKILNRDPKKLEILDKIDIDLASVEDMNALRSAREREIIRTCIGEDNYLFNKSTDFAALTGRQKYSDMFYLSDHIEHLEESEVDISYYENGTFCSTDNDSIRYSRKYIIRPVLRFNRCPELFNTILLANGIDINSNEKFAKILLGWMPKYVANKTDQAKLNQALKEKIVIKTSDVYTIDGTYVHDEKNIKKEFKPLDCPVYECGGKRFIHFKVFQNYGGNDFIDKITLSKSDAIALSNGQTYFNGDMVWILVSEIPWIVDIERKTLIAQEGLLCGIQYENYTEKNIPDIKNNPISIWKYDKTVDYQASNIKWFLETHMKYEMLANEQILFNKDKKDTKTTNDDKTSEITDLLDRIKKYMKFYYGDVDIISKVNDLINEYNIRLDEIANNIGHESNSLSIGINNPKLLYQKLILNLNDVLRELIIHGEKVKNYHDMIEILEECQKDKIDTSKDEICESINNIKTVVLEFIINDKIKNKLKEELNKIITDEINHNKAYIEEFKNNDNAKTKSLDELKLEFKRNIHPYLIILDDIVSKQDLVNEIMNNVHIMTTNHFTGSKNKIVKNYLAILNDIITRIKEIGTEEDINELTKIAHLDFDINEDINVILRKLESMIIKAYKIELNIQERHNIIKEINDLKVCVDFLEDKTK